MSKINNILIYTLALIGIFLMLTISCKKKESNRNPIATSPSTPSTPTTVTDIDGNVYEVVTIDSQVWMAENLNVSRYNNGDNINKITDRFAWSNLTSGAYCDFDNKPSNSETYGKLYNFYVTEDSRRVCPTGYHIPSYYEWATLIIYLGGDTIAGGKLKEAGTTHWSAPNTGATNESGFTALPGMNRDSDGQFLGLVDSSGRELGFWWTETQYDINFTWFRRMTYMDTRVATFTRDKKSGLSVRCIKD